MSHELRLSDRFYEWVIRKTRESPGRTILIGFIPALIFTGVPLVRDMVSAVRDQPWMALIYVPLLLALGLVGYMMWLLGKVLKNMDPPS